MRFKRPVSILATTTCLILIASIVYAASAQMVFTPGGQLLGGAYQDKNGKLEEQKGDAATFAAVIGNMNDKHKIKDHKKDEKDLLASVTGGAIDNKQCDGLIVDAEIPLWIVGLQSSMTVSSSAFQGINFDGVVEGKARGVLFVEFGNARFAVAREILTTNQTAPTPYDIQEDLAGIPTNFADAGTKHKPASDLGSGGGIDSITLSAGFFKFSPGISFLYESRATGSMKIDFEKTGKETVNVEVNQVDGQWQGIALAWDWLPVPPGPILLQVFVLD